MPVSSQISGLHRSRLHRVLTEIRERPETFDQRTHARATASATTYDFAGHAIRIYAPDLAPVWEPDEAGEESATASTVSGPDGSVQAIGVLAAKILGLTDEEMQDLCVRSHRFAEVQQIINRLTHPGYSRDWDRRHVPAESR